MSWESAQPEAIEAAMAGLRRCGGLIEAVGADVVALIVTVTLHAATPIIEAHLLDELAGEGTPR